MRLILASSSPRRRELLALLNIPFDIKRPSFDERLTPDRSAIEQVQDFAQGKAESIAQEDPDAVVLGSDTLIELDHSLLGKPADLPDARAMLQRLAGRSHLVHTAVAVVRHNPRCRLVAVSTAEVRMNAYDQRVHDQYLSTGESLGKAGAYSIQGQGSALVDAIQGDFPTVVGLPLRIVARLLAQVGVTVPIQVEDLYVSMPYPNWDRFGHT
jgi:septum formation protein